MVLTGPFWFLSSFGVLFLAQATSAQGPLLTIPQGQLQGLWSNSYQNRTYSAFFGIPYAQPPLGPLRFQPPQPASSWEGVLIANNTPVCPQLLKGLDDSITYFGVEDCLYVNVFVPTLDPSNVTTKLPVMVDIHGGAFVSGGAIAYSGPAYIMDRDILLVTFNYRLGPIGFLSTEDEVLPGNNGLKDQSAALRWVSENIGYFGGDPDNVVLTGTSAGGASVQFQLLSPLSRGLFKSAYSASGTALAPWSLQEAALDKAKLIGDLCGCPFTTTQDLVSCLSEVPARQIIEAMSSPVFQPWMGLPFCVIGAVIEGNVSNAFLPDHPYRMISSGQINDVPHIQSVVTGDGLYPSASFLNKPETLPTLDSNWDTYCPYLLDFNYTLPSDQHAQTCSAIKTRYLNDQPISNATFMQLTQIVTDRIFLHYIEKSANVQANAATSPVYVYMFNYLAEAIPSLCASFSTVSGFGVPCHGDDALMYFSNFLRPLEPLTPNDEKMMNAFLDILVSMAVSGKPSSDSIGFEWLPVEKASEGFRYLRIDSPNSMRIVDQSSGNSSFWDGLGFKENENFERGL